MRRAAALRGADVSFSDLVRGWAAGSGWAVSAIERNWTALAAAIITLDELLHPSCVVVGGGVAAELPGFVDGLARTVTGLLRPGQQAIQIEPAKLGALSSLDGAVLLANEGIASP